MNNPEKLQNKYLGAAKQGKMSFILTFSVIIFIAVIVASVYFNLQKASLEGQKERLEEDIAAVRTEISAMEEKKVRSAKNAQDFLAMVEDEEIIWSQVFTRIRSLVPYSAVTQKSKIAFLSYSGADNGTININAETAPAERAPYDDVAELITLFNDSTYFYNAHVPTISGGENELGDKVLSFIFNISYEDTTSAEIITEEEEAMIEAESEAEKVPRVTDSQ
jgi:Tfp pilus assembly protein PilN